MGYLRDKYTEEYFTGRTADGNAAGYGALGHEEWRNGDIYEDIKKSIDRTSLENRRVLEIGFGRGESARYLIEQKGVTFYLGIDFSESAMKLASETLSHIEPRYYRLCQGDALEILSGGDFGEPFDVVFMLDVIEHIPRSEVDPILRRLHRLMKRRGHLVVHTPFYKIDEDFLAQGENYLEPSATDIHPKTRGMHCNKYTSRRLIRELRSAGFRPIGGRLYERASGVSYLVQRVKSLLR